ncbi:putative secreted protein [Thiogranum longum]|uniref:Putative secreted protein n=1 Tax=Thiogranum longum TaxID=1537524 RepID=A0A4R1HBG9_9GAMM|nr:PEP-CTERM sorting domain-containing protein [Thiogranum longum]TCK17520.1 putative secreted protein [Thiogranum longum]
MQKHYWILPLFCLVATPVNASLVSIDSSENSDLLHQDKGNYGRQHHDHARHHALRHIQNPHFNKTFGIEHPGLSQEKFEDWENAPLSGRKIEFATDKHNISSHLLDHLRNKDGFIVDATPGKHGFSIFAREHNKNHDDDFSLDVPPHTTSAVPLPASVWLFGSGLIGLIASVRRKTA